MKLTSILKIKEDASAGAVSAGDVAGVVSPLGTETQKKKKKKKGSYLDSVLNRKPTKMFKRSFGAMQFKKTPTVIEYYRDMISSSELYERADTEFNPQDVMSRLSASERFADDAGNTVIYGLEDSDGGIIKVYIKKDEAEEFEQILGRELEDKTVDAQEIAELLFKLKDRISIVNVVWPSIQEDEEEEQPDMDSNIEMGLDDADDGADGADGDALPDKEGIDLEGEGDLPDPDASGGEMQSTLNQIIDMLKSQAESSQAEAEAKSAEARAKEAESAAKAAEAKIKSEEEILDMESHFKKQKTEDKESRKLAKIAQYRHEVEAENQPNETDLTDGGIETPEEPDMASVSDLAPNENEEQLAANKLIDYLINSQRTQR